jgi:hypothetical protein
MSRVSAVFLMSRVSIMAVVSVVSIVPSLVPLILTVSKVLVVSLVSVVSVVYVRSAVSSVQKQCGRAEAVRSTAACTSSSHERKNRERTQLLKEESKRVGSIIVLTGECSNNDCEGADTKKAATASAQRRQQRENRARARRKGVHVVWQPKASANNISSDRTG